MYSLHMLKPSSWHRWHHLHKIKVEHDGLSVGEKGGNITQLVTLVSAHTPMHSHTNTQTHAQTHRTHTYTHAHRHTQHTHIHTHAHNTHNTHTQTYMHTHTHIHHKQYLANS